MTDFFINKNPNIDKLLNYGFKKQGNKFIYTTVLDGSGFKMSVGVSENGEVFIKVIDTSIDEQYTLHLVDGVEGGFVGQVRTEYENVLNSIVQSCFESSVFKFDYTASVLEYVKNTYGTEPEYLWKDENAVFRRKDNTKWYGIIMRVSAKRLGLDSEEIIEIMDVKLQPDLIEKLVDDKNYFRAYHMNKKHWLTFILDGRVDFKEICRYIDNSYILAGKK